MSNLRNILDGKTKISTSPTLPGSSKKHLLSPSSESEESAWTSSTSPSYIHLNFPTHRSNATHFSITFQGGFAARSIMVYVATRAKEGSSEIELGLMMARRVYPVDKSSRQVFEIPYPSNTLIAPHSTPSLPLSTSTEDLTIETERPPNTEGRTSPAPLLQAAKNRLPAGYKPHHQPQQSISSTLDLGNGSASTNGTGTGSASGAGGGSGIDRVASNESGVVRDRLGSGWTVPDLTEIKFEFEGSSDNQGRITVYSVELLGP